MNANVIEVKKETKKTRLIGGKRDGGGETLTRSEVVSSGVTLGERDRSAGGVEEFGADIMRCYLDKGTVQSHNNVKHPFMRYTPLRSKPYAKFVRFDFDSARSDALKDCLLCIDDDRQTDIQLNQPGCHINVDVNTTNRYIAIPHSDLSPLNVCVYMSLCVFVRVCLCEMVCVDLCVVMCL